jgi:hypothetical protein
MRILLAALLFLALSLASSGTVRAQLQEERMLKILEPDKNRASDFQNKTFNGTGSGSFQLKPARVKPFELRGRPMSRTFTPRKAASKAFFQANEKAETSPAYVKENAIPLNAVEVETVPVQGIFDADKAVATRDLPDRDRVPAAGSGFFELPLSKDNPNRKASGDAQLTIDQVREILNKSK